MKHLGGSLSWASHCWFQLGSWSQGREIEPHVWLCTGCGTCLRFSLSLCPHSQRKKERKVGLKWVREETWSFCQGSMTKYPGNSLSSILWWAHREMKVLLLRHALISLGEKNLAMREGHERNEQKQRILFQNQRVKFQSLVVWMGKLYWHPL